MNGLPQEGALELARRIDHTLLKPDASDEAIIQLCAQALQYSFFSVCVPPSFVALAAKQLASSQVSVCTVVGFPLGYHHTDTKVFETQKAIADGATEIDMVMNIGMAKMGHWAAVRADIQAVVQAAQSCAVKVIIETCLLTTEEITQACNAAMQAGATFVKTSTGFGSAGAKVDHVAQMKKAVGDRLQVKASGGIKNLEQYQAMVAAGADRIGASSGIAILEEFNKNN